MAKQSAFAKSLQIQTERKIDEARFHTRVHMMDMVTVALGRMGWGEKRLKDFDKVLADVCKEYAEITIDDAKADKDLTYAKACLDRELQRYTGSLFVPYEERHQ